jgi:hypothetical protein
MAFLLLVPAVLFVAAELSWLLGPRAAASTLPLTERGLPVTGAAIVGGVVCPLVTVLLALRLRRAGHRVIGGALCIVAPVFLALALLGYFH